MKWPMFKGVMEKKKMRKKEGNDLKKNKRDNMENNI